MGLDRCLLRFLENNYIGRVFITNEKNFHRIKIKDRDLIIISEEPYKEYNKKRGSYFIKLVGR